MLLLDFPGNVCLPMEALKKSILAAWLIIFFFKQIWPFVLHIFLPVDFLPQGQCTDEAPLHYLNIN
jgi:hypothetical protein